jgi:hypothetical protein
MRRALLSGGSRVREYMLIGSIFLFPLDSSAREVDGKPTHVPLLYLFQVQSD